MATDPKSNMFCSIPRNGCYKFEHHYYPHICASVNINMHHDWGHPRSIWPLQIRKTVPTFLSLAPNLSDIAPLRFVPRENPLYCWHMRTKCITERVWSLLEMLYHHSSELTRKRAHNPIKPCGDSITPPTRPNPKVCNAAALPTKALVMGVLLGYKGDMTRKWIFTMGEPHYLIACDKLPFQPTKSQQCTKLAMCGHSSTFMSPK